MNTRIRSAFLHQILHFLLAINFALNALLFSSSLFEVVLFDASLFRQLLLQEQAQLLGLMRVNEARLDLVHLVLALFAEQLWGFLWSQRRTSESVSVGSKLGL